MSELKEEQEQQYPQIIDGVIHNEDGTRFTENKKLRLIKFPQISTLFKNREKEPIDDETEEEIKKIFDMFCVDDHAKPQAIEDALKSVNYHLEQPDIMRVIEDFNLDCQINGIESVTFPKFMNYLNEKLANFHSWPACGKVFHQIKDKELMEKEGISEITDKSLFEVVKEIGIDDLSLDDITYIMNLVSNGQDPNITQDEFYYLMSKRPIEYDALANITKSFKN